MDKVDKVVYFYENQWKPLKKCKASSSLGIKRRIFRDLVSPQSLSLLHHVCHLRRWKTDSEMFCSGSDEIPGCSPSLPLPYWPGGKPYWRRHGQVDCTGCGNRRGRRLILWILGQGILFLLSLIFKVGYVQVLGSFQVTFSCGDAGNVIISCTYVKTGPPGNVVSWSREPRKETFLVITNLNFYFMICLICWIVCSLLQCIFLFLPCTWYQQCWVVARHLNRSYFYGSVACAR